MNSLSEYDKKLGYCEEAQTYCSEAEERYIQGKIDELNYIIERGTSLLESEQITEQIVLGISLMLGIAKAELNSLIIMKGSNVNE